MNNRNHCSLLPSAAWAIVFLLEISSGCLAQTRTGVRAIPVKPGRTISPHEVPPEACLPLLVDIGTALPTPVARELLDYVTNRVRKSPSGTFEVDRDGSGERWTPLSADNTKPVEWFYAGRNMSLLFFSESDRWWVTAAQIHEATQGDFSLELMDTDGDGIYWERTDYLRWRAGTFRSHAGIDVVDDGELRGRLQLIRRAKQPTILFQETGRPDNVGDSQWAAHCEVSRIRNLHGMPPCEAWREADTLLQKHAEYLAKNDPNNESLVLSIYSQSDSLPLHDQPAAELAKGADVTWMDPKSTIAEQVQSALRSTRERSAYFFPRLAKLGLGIAGHWRCMIAAPADDRAGQRYAVLPAAGSKSVPLTSYEGRYGPNSATDMFRQPRGFPISVHIEPRLASGPQSLQVQSIALSKKADGSSIAGFSFTIRDFEPMMDEHSSFFVPGAPLEPETDYVVHAIIESRLGDGTGDARGLPVDRLVWSFRTGK